MSIYKRAIPFLSFIISGCLGNNSDSDGADYKSFEDFESTVSDFTLLKFSDDYTKECGVVRLGEDHLEVNTCAAEAFSNGDQFIAIYELQGIDSGVGLAYTKSDESGLLIWRYDSNPCGGIPACDSEIRRMACVNPRLSEVLDGTPTEIFVCD